MGLIKQSEKSMNIERNFFAEKKLAWKITNLAISNLSFASKILDHILARVMLSCHWHQTVRCRCHAVNALKCMPFADVCVPQERSMFPWPKMVAKTERGSPREETSTCECTLPRNPHVPPSSLHHKRHRLCYGQCWLWRMLLMSCFQRDCMLFLVGRLNGNQEYAVNCSDDIEKQIAKSIQASPFNCLRSNPSWRLSRRWRAGLLWQRCPLTSLLV